MYRSLTVLLTLSVAAPALAWNKAGHMVSGAIAAAALKQDNPAVFAKVVAFGAIIGIITVLFSFTLGASRVWFAISRDGLLEGPDDRLLSAMVEVGRGAVIASGGISSLADLRAVAELGCQGAIVGRAIYEGRIDVAEAVRLAATLDVIA